MPKDDTGRLKAVKDKLDALVRCVLLQAESDAAFAEKLHQLFCTPSIPEAPKAVKRNKDVFNPVTFYSDHGRDRLRAELDKKDNSELAGVLRFHRVMQKVPPAKDLDRAVAIGAILSYAETELTRGGVFVDKVKPEGEAAQDAAAKQPAALAGSQGFAGPAAPEPGKAAPGLEDDRTSQPATGQPGDGPAGRSPSPQ